MRTQWRRQRMQTKRLFDVIVFVFLYSIHVHLQYVSTTYCCDRFPFPFECCTNGTQCVWWASCLRRSYPIKYQMSCSRDGSVVVVWYMSPHDVEAFFFLLWNVNRSLMKSTSAITFCFEWESFAFFIFCKMNRREYDIPIFSLTYEMSSFCQWKRNIHIWHLAFSLNRSQ